MRKLIPLFCLALLSAGPLPAQQEVSLPMLQDIPGSEVFNPAFVTGYAWSVSLPALSTSLVADGPNVRDLVSKSPGGGYVLHVADAINNLKDQNHLYNTTKLRLFGLSHEWKNTRVFFNLNTRNATHVGFSKQLAQFAAYGNGPYVGDSLHIGPQLDVTAYSETALGLSHRFGKLRIGAAAKLLFGLASARTVKHDLTLYTDPEYYQLSLTSDYVVEASSLLRLNDSLVNIDFTTLKNKFSTSANRGFAWDFGLVWEMTKAFSVSVSLIDWGQIHWTENAKQYESHGTYTYDGLAVKTISEIDSAAFNQVLDSVQQVLNFSAVPHDFTTVLPRKLLVGGTYRFGKMTVLNGMLDLTQWAGTAHPAFSLGARSYVNKQLAIGGVLSYNNREIDHLGINASVKLGPLQVYALSDNVLSYLFPGTANDLHFRVGAALLFGKQENE